MIAVYVTVSEFLAKDQTSKNNMSPGMYCVKEVPHILNVLLLLLIK